jgi:hypothetical protein
VFNKKKDLPVREAWEKVLAHACTKRPETEAEAKKWDDRILDLRIDLYQRLGAAVGIDYGLDYIKTHMYYPQYHVDAELEWLQIRRLILKLLSSEELQKKLSTGQVLSSEEIMKQFGTNQVPGKLVVPGEQPGRVGSSWTLVLLGELLLIQVHSLVAQGRALLVVPLQDCGPAAVP